jgi:predicted kinase
MLVITIGCSGSGKSHLKNQLENKLDFVNVEMDEIRRNLCGNVTDQSKNNQVFMISKSMVNKNVNSKNVFYNATNLDWKRSVQFVLDLDKDEKVPVVFIFMEDSVNLELCQKRVHADISANMDRSNTSDDIIEKQHNRYMKCKHDAHIKGIGIDDLPDNWKTFIYKNNFEELIYFLEGINGNN